MMVILIQTSTFNAGKDAAGTEGKFTEMMKIFEDIKTSGCTPDIVTWNTLLAVFGQNGMDTEVSGVFREMKRAGFVAERDTFNTLISAYSSSLLHAYANGKQIERMNALAEDIYSGVIESHPALLKTLVLVYSKSDLLMETECAFLELRKKGLLVECFPH
ncbi:hypothetical protein Leryth_026485 [Lithospermum erythrorhizon]|nr:hypothetical protein Leryth_026485 [Lithospermum erythrorhizon]